MLSIIIATHGTLAQGLKSALELIMGPQPKVHAICGYMGDERVEDMFARVMGEVAPEDTLVVCTDLFGGSVNQTLLGQIDLERAHLISGVSLPVLLELVMRVDENLSAEEIRTIVATAREELCYAPDRLGEVEDGDDDFDF